MKKAILVIAALAIFAATANAEDMKMKVPVDTWRQLRSRLYDLEKENSHLRKSLKGQATSVTPADMKRVKALEEENGRLKSEVQAMAGEAERAKDVDGLKQRVSELEKENSRLAGESKSASGADRRIASLKRANLRLKKKLRATKSGAVAISYTGEKHSARHEFFLARHKAAIHHIFTE